MIFPNIKNASFGYLNLDLESRQWAKDRNISSSIGANTLLDPALCQEFIDDMHKKYSLDFSYGGWMEDRTHLWRGGYLEKQKNFIHLGIDINVPPGTDVACDFKGEVVKIGDDYPLDGGWGPHVVFKHASEDVHIIYAHLKRDIMCKLGDTLEPGTIFAKIGHAPENGNWFPHVHVQVIRSEYYPDIADNWEGFDGYGLRSDLELNAKKHPDPMQYISLS